MATKGKLWMCLQAPRLWSTPLQAAIMSLVTSCRPRMGSGFGRLRSCSSVSSISQLRRLAFKGWCKCVSSTWAFSGVPPLWNSRSSDRGSCFPRGPAHGHLCERCTSPGTIAQHFLGSLSHLVASSPSTGPVHICKSLLALSATRRHCRWFSAS